MPKRVRSHAPGKRDKKTTTATHSVAVAALAILPWPERFFKARLRQPCSMGAPIVLRHPSLISRFRLGMMRMTLTFLVTSNFHHSTAVVLKTPAIDISFASTVCAVEEDASDKAEPRLRTARWR